MNKRTVRPPLYLERVIPLDTNAAIVDYFATSSRKPRSYQGLVDHRLRECDFVKMPSKWDDLFCKVTAEHMRRYYERDIDPNLIDRPMIYGYPVGVGFVAHHDQVTAIEKKRGETNGQPVVGGDYSIVLFCTEPESYGGGELFFPKYGWEYKPPAGSIVVYPSTTAYVHGVHPITHGIRHTVVCRMFNLPE